MKNKGDNMLKIKNVKVNGYEFTGYVNITDLNPGQLDALKIINPETHDKSEIEVFGSFSVYASEDDTQLDSIEYVTLLGALTGGTVKEQQGYTRTKCPVSGLDILTRKMVDVPKRVMLDLDENDYDVDKLCDDILSQDDGSWYQDKLESMADYYMDQDR